MQRWTDEQVGRWRREWQRDREIHMWRDNEKDLVEVGTDQETDRMRDGIMER
jgi:hypothetical protein